MDTCNTPTCNRQVKSAGFCLACKAGYLIRKAQEALSTFGEAEQTLANLVLDEAINLWAREAFGRALGLAKEVLEEAEKNKLAGQLAAADQYLANARRIPAEVLVEVLEVAVHLGREPRGLKSQVSWLKSEIWDRVEAAKTAKFTDLEIRRRLSHAEFALVRETKPKPMASDRAAREAARRYRQLQRVALQPKGMVGTKTQPRSSKAKASAKR